MSGEGGLYPIAKLIDDLKSEDLKSRLNSMNQLATISNALGQERTRNELLPFIVDMVEDEDETLFTLAENLGNLLDCIGGPHYASYLLPALEKLGGIDDTTVRDKAMEGIKRIVARTGVKPLEKDMMALVTRMMEIDSFPYKLSALSLMPILYSHLGSHNQTEILGHMSKSSKSEVPQVRRAAAYNLREIIPKVTAVHEGEMVGMFTAASQDVQDSVRLMSVDLCIALTKSLSPDKINTHLFPYIKSIAKDPSWRMRFMLADKILELAKNLDSSVVCKELASYFADFLVDPESEVRTAAAARFGDFSKLLDVNTIVDRVIPSIKKLANDNFVYVRKAVAENLLKICPLIGGTQTNQHIIPTLLILLKDQSSEVVLPLFKNIGHLNKVIGLDSLAQSIVPAIANLAKDKKNWRSRLTMVEYFPILAQQTEEEFFNDKFLEMCLDGLTDSVHTIREASIENIQKITEIFGAKWAEKYTLPKVLSLHTNTNYLMRQIPLFAVMRLAPMLSTDSIEKTIIPVLLILAKDKIPNIKFNVSKTLKEIASFVKGTQLSVIKSTLKSFSSDPDFDVRYFAETYLKSI